MPVSEINLNTAPPVVLQAVAPGLDLATAELIVADRDSGVPFTTTADFYTDSRITGGTSIKEEGLSVQSSFFQVSVRARYQDRYGFSPASSNEIEQMEHYE